MAGIVKYLLEPEMNARNQFAQHVHRPVKLQPGMIGDLTDQINQSSEFDPGGATC
ncbi:MAG TPA: hypothetical protein VJ972_00065 [Anaerolineales bacterium]|nr:hypothetical protein [Anaerolineales bacterium]